MAFICPLDFPDELPFRLILFLLRLLIGFRRLILPAGDGGEPDKQLCHKRLHGFDVPVNVCLELHSRFLLGFVVIEEVVKTFCFLQAEDKPLEEDAVNLAGWYHVCSSTYTRCLGEKSIRCYRAACC